MMLASYISNVEAFQTLLEYEFHKSLHGNRIHGFLPSFQCCNVAFMCKIWIGASTVTDERSRFEIVHRVDDSAEGVGDVPDQRGIPSNRRPSSIIHRQGFHRETRNGPLTQLNGRVGDILLEQKEEMTIILINSDRTISMGNRFRVGRRLLAPHSTFPFNSTLILQLSAVVWCWYWKEASSRLFLCDPAQLAIFPFSCWIYIYIYK